MKRQMGINMRPSFLLAVLWCLLCGCSTANNWLDRLGRGGAAATTASLTEEEIVAGLKEALGNGLDYAVTNLGREGGFLQNSLVRIPLPESLAPVERTLRTLGQ